jgi:hypothetical protein
MAFALYLLGFIVLISGLASLATFVGLSQAYVAAGAAVLFVVAVFFSLANARARNAA